MVLRSCCPVVVTVTRKGTFKNILVYVVQGQFYFLSWLFTTTLHTIIFDFSFSQKLSTRRRMGRGYRGAKSGVVHMEKLYCEDMERYLVVLCRSKCKHEMQSRSAICFVMRSFDC